MFVTWLANLLRRTFFSLFMCSNLLDKWICYCLHFIPENRSTKENTIIHWFLGVDAVCKRVGSLAKVLAVRLCFLFQNPQINPTSGLSLQLFLGILSWVADFCLYVWFKALLLSHFLFTISLCLLLGFEFLPALLSSLPDLTSFLASSPYHFVLMFDFYFIKIVICFLSMTISFITLVFRFAGWCFDQ